MKDVLYSVKLLPDFEHYSINCHGVVYKTSPLTGRIYELKISVTTEGACYVILEKAGRPKRHYIARLVATLWKKNPNKYKHLHFKDGDFKNTDSKNISWVKYKSNDPVDNVPDRISARRRALERVSSRGHITDYECAYDAVDDGFSRQGIYRSLKTGKPYKKYYWRYKDIKI